MQRGSTILHSHQKWEFLLLQVFIGIWNCSFFSILSVMLLLLLLSRFSRVWLCATPVTAAHQAPPSLGFSRQEHWSELPFPSPMHGSEKWKWSRSVVSDSSDPMDCSLPGSSIHGICQARVLEQVAIAFSIICHSRCVIGSHCCFYFQVSNNITTNKASGGDRIPVELSQILKDDVVKALHSICQQIWKTQQWPQDWKRSVFIPIPKKGNAKECLNYRTIALISHTSKVMLKILQARL